MFKSANIGSVDRIIRLVVGAILIVGPFVYTSALWSGPVLGWLVPVIGLILIATALFRFCPLYRLIGVDTRKTG